MLYEPRRTLELDRVLAQIRPRREPLSLAVDGLVVAVAWNATYLFRLGFERWLSARPSYDGWVLLSTVLAYATAFSLLKVPQGMWRFSGFGEVKRLALACLLAGLASAVAADAAGAACNCRAALDHALITAPDKRDPAMVQRLRPIAGRVLPPLPTQQP